MLFTLFLLVSACVFPPFSQKPTIEFYFFENDSNTDYISVSDIDSLPLQSEPWLTQDDIAFYEWSGQHIYLKDNKSDVLEEYYNGDTLIYPLKAQAFAILVDETPVYIGYINNFYKNFHFTNPLISDIELLFYPQDMLAFFDMKFTDIPYFDDELIKGALMDNNLYHGGLEIKYDYDYGIVISDSNDVTSVEFQFKLKNLDEDNLLYLDPAKIGSEVFSYLIISPSFSGIDGAERVTRTQSQDIIDHIPDSSDFARDAIYSILNSGDSTTLHIQLSGYNNFEVGAKYNFMLWFMSPMGYGSKEFRIKDNGRVWVGWEFLPTLSLDYTGPGRNEVTSSENPAMSVEKTKLFIDSRFRQNFTY